MSVLAESAEALLSFKNGGFKVKRELDFGDDDSDQGNQAMTLGPEMFGLKRITDVNTRPPPAAKGNGNPVTPIALNRRGLVSSCINKPCLSLQTASVVHE
jgi:hypothetical protein